jgi:hypothetical protein
MNTLPKTRSTMLPPNVACEHIRCQSEPGPGEFTARVVAKAWRKAGRPATFYVCFARAGRRGAEVLES